MLPAARGYKPFPDLSALSQAASERLTNLAATKTAGGTVTIVSTGRVLVRSLPERSGAILGYVNNGDVYTLLEQSADGAWLKIDFGSSGGWISATLAQVGE